MGHTTKIGNFSVASVEFSVDSGTNIADTQSTATLTLIPDAGFTITASDFSYTSGPSQVSGVTFAQSGDNVVATVTFVSDAVMPSSDLNIPLCISGESGLVSFSLAGNIEVIASSNVTPVSGNIAYTASGNVNDEVQVFSQSITAASNYYFPDEPTGNLTSGDSSRYEFTTSKTIDNAGLITAKTFTGVYTFGNSSVTGDVFTIVADAVAIPSITREITNYSILKTDISAVGETRAMVIYGTVGAEFSLTVVNEDNTSVLTSPLTNVAIPESGIYSFNITFPSVNDDDDYDFVLTGDLADPFPQDTTFTINQPANTAPVATPQSFSVAKGGTKTLTLAGTDADLGDTLSFKIITLPSEGKLYTDSAKTDEIISSELPYTLTGSTVYYEHDDSDDFADSFTFKVNDGTVDSSAATVSASITVAAAGSLSTNITANSGVYKIPVTVGTAAGTYKVHFNAGSVPARIQILFDDGGYYSNDFDDMSVVADSLFVGDNVTSSIPANASTTVNIYDFNDGAGSYQIDWDDSGSDEVVTIDDEAVCQPTGSRTDAIPNGSSRGSSASQIGVQNGVYISSSATNLTEGLDYHDGNICLTYTKPASTAYTAYIKITAVDSAGNWNIYKTEFVAS